MSDVANSGGGPASQPAQPRVSLRKKITGFLASTGIFHPEEWPVKPMLRTVVALCVIVFVLAVMRQGVAHVRETEVGVLADNIRGELITADRIGYHFFIPYIANFYVLDKTIQKLSLTWDQPNGGEPRDVKVKTADGNNVSMDVTVNFKIIPERASEVLRDSGLSNRFSEVWMEPYVRHACMSYIGQLDTEQMYDATKRNEKATLAKTAMNERLKAHGIEVISVMPGQPRFPKDYEDIINQKKLADQQVEEQQALGRSATQNRERLMITAQKETETKLAVFDGQLTNQFIQALSEANKTKRDAEGQNRTTKLQADGALYMAKQEAEGKRATMVAEAEGMELMRKAVAGEGGVQMVGMEYARRLNTVKFTGTAITKQPTVEQISIQRGAAADAAGGGK